MSHFSTHGMVRGYGATRQAVDFTEGDRVDEFHLSIAGNGDVASVPLDRRTARKLARAILAMTDEEGSREPHEG